MTRADLIDLGRAIARAQTGSAAVTGYQPLLAYLRRPARLRAALERLQRQAQEQVSRWSRVVVLCQQLRGPEQADTKPPPPPLRPDAQAWLASLSEKSLGLVALHRSGIGDPLHVYEVTDAEVELAFRLARDRALGA